MSMPYSDFYTQIVNTEVSSASSTCQLLVCVFTVHLFESQDTLLLQTAHLFLKGGLVKISWWLVFHSFIFVELCLYVTVVPISSYLPDSHFLAEYCCFFTLIIYLVLLWEMPCQSLILQFSFLLPSFKTFSDPDDLTFHFDAQ